MALPTDDVPDLMKLQDGDYNNGNSGCLVGSTFAKDHNIKVGSRISIGTDGEQRDPPRHRDHRGTGNEFRYQHRQCDCRYPGMV